MNDFDARIEALQAELLKRRAHTLPRGRWSAYQHGMGTFRILEAWDRPQRTQLAGLALAAGSFADERQFVGSLLGDDADRLARLVHDADATAVVAAASGADPSDVGEANAIALASLAERSCAEDGSPGRWLALGSRLAAEVRRLTALPPPPFGGGTELVSEPAEATLAAAYLRVTGSAARPDAAAQAALADAARAVPWVAEPLVVLGLMRLAEADVAGAAEYGSRAGEILLAWNCAWDKRLSEFAWYALAQFLAGQAALADDERAFSAARMRALLERHGASPGGIFAQLDAVGVLELPAPPGDDGGTVDAAHTADPEDRLDDLEFDELPARFQSYIARLSEDDPAADMEIYPSLSARPWWDPDEVAVAPTIAALAEGAFAELQVDERLREHDDSVALLVRSAGKGPVIARLLAEQRDVVVAEDGVRLVRVQPASTLAGERPSSNLRLRCIVAVGGRGTATVVVNDVADTLRPGDCLVFDPIFPHEFRAAEDGAATILCVDIWHPELSPSEVQLLAGFARYVRELSSRQQRQPADRAPVKHG